MTPSEALLRLMCLPPSQFAGVCRTSDGYYHASLHGDIGYNYFLGRPAPLHDGPGRNQMLKVWRGLRTEERRAVMFLAWHPLDGTPIPLARDFGVPTDEVGRLKNEIRPERQRRPSVRRELD